MDIYMDLFYYIYYYYYIKTLNKIRNVTVVIFHRRIKKWAFTEQLYKIKTIMKQHTFCETVLCTANLAK